MKSRWVDIERGHLFFLKAILQGSHLLILGHNVDSVKSLTFPNLATLVFDVIHLTEVKTASNVVHSFSKLFRQTVGI